MSVLKVNPNRMEVLSLRKRLKLSKRGHKLLKQKQDELMKILNSLLQEAKGLRREVEDKASRAYRLFFFAEASCGEGTMRNAVSFSGIKTSVESGKKRLLNLIVPEIKIRIEYKKPCTGFLNTNAAMDEAMSAWEDFLPSLGKLYELETQITAVAEEVEKTRRRVNALEYILIPNIEETIKHIIMKLDEIERGNRVRLMKVKELAKEES
jgi:V/A-type H+/Na+-transporting ATPase subunit D